MNKTFAIKIYSKNLFSLLILILLCSFSTAIYANEILYFSHERGLYTEPFSLEITSNNPNEKILYTLDGTNPFTSKTSISSNTPLIITVDPNNNSNRDYAPGFIIKSCAVINDSLASKIYTHTYLFTNKIIEFSIDNILPGPSWLTFINEREHDISYGLDPEIYNNPTYATQMNEAFTSLPIFSLVIDLDSLFDTYRGIYSNAFFHGRDWERDVSLELLNHNGTNSFQIDCGIRIRGGWSRHNDNPKHAFRFIFRKEYGVGKLKYPLFGKEGVEEFDNIDLRTSQNYSWAYKGNSGNTFLKEVFSRDTQRDMNQPYTRSRYYHLYINGTYWGLYQTQERSEASFAASYFGGNKDDYDVIKVNAGENFDKYSIEATDGTLDKWKELWDAGEVGFRNDELYFKLQGLNSDGSRNPNYEKLLDVDNLIDYMLITFFTGDFDGPITNYRNNERPNNFYTIYNRINPDGFKFFRHDAEHSMQDRDWGLDRTGPFQAGEQFQHSNPQWIHQKLSDNKNYRLRFADRVYKHFFNNGALTLDKNIKRINERKAQIETAIIAESARWGDSKREEPFTKTDWNNAVDFILNTFLPNRNSIVLEQLINKDLFNNLLPPQFSSARGLVNRGLAVAITSTESTIYYTEDNTDPKNNYNGDVSSTAKLYNQSIIINETTQIKTRSLTNNKWSILNEAKFIIDENLSNLKITELHYHPLDEVVGQDTISGKEFEFIELKNIGLTELNLSSSFFTNGIDYLFPKGTVISEGEIIVLASDSLNFKNRYSFFPNAEFSGQLNNGGEKIEFVNAANEIVFSFEYDDKSPWEESADGNGYSLVASKANPTDNPKNANYWEASGNVGGSPGLDDIVSSVLTEKNNIKTTFELEQNYPNPFNPTTTIKYSVETLHTTSLQEQLVQLTIYDVLGRAIATLINKKQNPGNYEVTFDASNLASGVFYYQITIGNKIKTKKMIVLK